MDLGDFPRLAEFLVRCIDEESLGGLRLRRNQAGAKFIAPWRCEEPLFGPNVAEVVVPSGDSAVDQFLEDTTRLHYGYPLRLYEDGYISPLFFIEVDVRRREDGGEAAYSLHPVLKSLGINRLLLEEAGLSREEVDLLARELTGDFGAFDAQFEAAAAALDIPDSLLADNMLDPMPQRTNGRQWSKTPILFVCDVSGVKYRLRYELSRFVDQSKFLQPKIPDTALGAVLDPMLNSLLEPKPRPPRFEVSAMNRQQSDAVDRALSASLTVITGPPGTGKSQVVVNILANCIASGESVLLASNNNKPLDEVRRRVAELMDGAGDFTFRLGNQQAFQETRTDMTGKLGHLVAADGQSQIPDLLRQLEALSLERDGLQRELDANRSAQADIERALANEKQITSTLPPIWVEHLGQEELGPVDTTKLRRIVGKLRRWTGKEPAGLLFAILKLLMGARLLEGIEANLRDLYGALPIAIQNHAFPGEGRSSAESLGIAALWLEQHCNWVRSHVLRREAEARLEALRTAETIFPELDDVNNRRVAAGKALFRAAWSDRLSSKAGSLKDAADRYFDHVDRWLKGGGKNKAFFDGYRQSAQSVLDGLPIWITTNLSVGAAVPFEPGLFDCVVIDEASQCDFASVLPLLFRAKRAVFVGDPKQLRHIPGVTSDQETYVADKSDASDLLVNFSPITRSAYDIAASSAVARGDDELLLSQHYRCHPDIIGFSNMAFYADRLVARTAAATSVDGLQAGMTWQHVDGTLLRTAKSAANETEAQAVVSLIQSVLDRLRNATTTIGVVTPFRLQADLIVNMLSAQSWWSSYEKRVTVGTAHAFQGSECDVMIFSPVVTKGMKESLVRFAAHSDELLNVAVTRARAALSVVGDAGSCLAAGGALKDLADYARKLSDRKAGRPTPRSEAEAAFARILDKLGFECCEEVPLYRHKDQAPYRLDFVYVSPSGNRYDLEVDGATHCENDRFQEDEIRDRIAEAAGYTVIRIPAVDVLKTPNAVAERLRHLT
ncbi:hypothetical protein JCM17844_28560 [Iodidimonas gelatinilytica]|uniref:DUF559 domain-containing protein n=1 Tax=Iodidimonas gelatinilytica TaxID=1236966 RepID=A0A5A7MWE0_9PROT|nr:AAA domain-containing protein [Iodidimonas gelatinilytica]GEQ99219.1 hypothetical protein JCM17844_28560 [Iodidimonas gelatinilytica]